MNDGSQVFTVAANDDWRARGGNLAEYGRIVLDRPRLIHSARLFEPRWQIGHVVFL